MRKLWRRNRLDHPTQSQTLVRGLIVKIKLLALATAAAFAGGAGILAPMAAFAAAGKSGDAFYFTNDEATKEFDAKTKEFDAKTKELDSKNKDLDARLAEAQARLEKAAHDVAELTSEIGGPLMDKFMVFDGEGPSRAIIGVQLDSESGKEGARIQEVSPGGPADEAGL